MEVTRRYWTVVGVGLFLALWGLVVARPLVLVGAAGVAAWLLAHQYRFVSVATAVPSTLGVEVSTPQQTTARESTQLSLWAGLDRSLPATVDVSLSPPVGVRGEPVSVTLRGDDPAELARTTLTWPVAGRFRVDDVTVVVTDDRGLFRQTVALDAGAAVTVTPRAPTDVHVGESGQAITAGFGEFDAGRAGGAVEPTEVREYVPGDAVRQIDWKSTARHDQLHVREFEGTSDRETLLLFDHSASMADGPPGTRKIDYARQLAVALVDQTGRSGEQFRYHAVGDGGVTETVTPADRGDVRGRIRDHLYAVEPTTAAPAGFETPDLPSAGRAAARLDPDRSAFDRTLEPYLADRVATRRRFESHPLYRALTSADAAASSAVWTVLVTDDADRAGLREAVKHARARSDRVTAFVTPTALFADREHADLDRAYDDYVDFESFRRELANLDRVSVYEVGPSDRLSTVLSAGRRRRRRRA